MANEEVAYLINIHVYVPRKKKPGARGLLEYLLNKHDRKLEKVYFFNLFGIITLATYSYHINILINYSSRKFK